MKNLSKKPWFNGAVIACIGVILYCILNNLSAVLSALGTFVGYFRAVILGAVFAYLLSPLAIFFSTKVFRGKVFDKTRWALSVILAVAVMLLAMTLLIGTLLPQLIDSIVLFSANIDGYATSLMYLIENSSLYNLIDQESFMSFSQNSLTSVTNFIKENAGNIVKENAGNIVGFAASSGKNIASTVIAMILAIYLLMDSKRVVNGVKQLFSLVLPETGYKLFRDFVVRCDNILINFKISHTRIEDGHVVNESDTLADGVYLLGIDRSRRGYLIDRRNLDNRKMRFLERFIMNRGKRAVIEVMSECMDMMPEKIMEAKRAIDEEGM